MSGVGIDFGSLLSRVAVIINAKAEVVADSQGERQVPSIVGFYADTHPLVGHEAERLLTRAWQYTITDLKKLLGMPFDEAKNLSLNHKISAGKKALVSIEVQNQGKSEYYLVQEIVAKLLSTLKETAENIEGKKVKMAVLTVPVDFSTSKKNALVEAAHIAGFSEVHLIPDPVAAALACDCDTISQGDVKPKNIFVLDIGSTFTITLLKIQAGLISIVSQEKSPLTAEAMESELMDHFVREFRSKTGLDCRESRRPRIKLQMECERVKRVLSQVQQASVQVDGLYEGIDFASNISRARFEGMCDFLFKKAIPPIQKVVDSVGGLSNVDGVILSGGGAKIPRLQQDIKNFFGPNISFLSQGEPTDLNAKGAAIHASLLQARNPLIKIKKIPSLSLSIGVASHDGSFVPIIPRETTIPTTVEKQFSVSPNQDKVLISVYEGENKLATQNRHIGEFILTNIPTDGKTKITVQFSVDQNAKLTIKAQDEGNIVQKLKIEGVNVRATKEEIELLKGSTPTKTENESK